MINEKLNNEIRKLKKAYTRGGLRVFSERLADYILMQFVAIGYTYKLDLDNVQYVPPDLGLTFEEMTVKHLDKIYNDHKTEMTYRVYQDLFEKLNDSSFEGFIVKKDGEICNYCFINYHTTCPLLKEKYVDENTNGYLLTDYVFNKFRNQKIQQYDIYMRLKVLKEKKFKTATGVVERYNYPSRSSIEKFGFKKCVVGYYFRLGKRRLSEDSFKIISS